MLDMRRRPCKCTGFRVDNCKCKIIRNGYSGNESGSVVLLTHSNSICRLLDLKDMGKTNIILRLLEKAYEKCAEYNLRYCPIRGFLRHGNYFSYTLKDFIILLCFLIANFVVFFAILAKTMVHLYFVVKVTVQWIRRSLLPKMDIIEEDVMMLNQMQWNHQYSPPIKHTRKYK